LSCTIDREEKITFNAKLDLTKAVVISDSFSRAKVVLVAHRPSTNSRQLVLRRLPKSILRLRIGLVDRPSADNSLGIYTIS
jgi:hypothetical protein